VACAHQPREKHIVTKKTSCLVILMMFVLLMPLLAMLAHQRNSPIVASAGHHVHLLESPRYRRILLCCKNTIATLRRNIVMMSSLTKPKSPSALQRHIAPLSRRVRSWHLSKFHCRGRRVVVLALRMVVASDAFFGVVLEGVTATPSTPPIQNDITRNDSRRKQRHELVAGVEQGRWEAQKQCRDTTTKRNTMHVLGDKFWRHVWLL